MHNLSNQSRTEGGFASRITFVFLGVLTIGVAAIVSLISLGAFTKPAPKAVVEAPAPPPASPAPAPASPGPNARPFAGRGLDPRLMRSPAPVLPVPISEEAQRMVADMLNVYRCQHSTSQRALAVALPASGEGSAALRQSLGTLPDPCYVNAVLPKLANPETPSAEMDTLFEDLIKRPDALKLRMMFIIANIDNHPKSAEALQQLRDLLRTDWQQDWGRWEQAVNQLAAHEERGVRIASCRAR
jgi:hypothetical protein